ncbi:MAG: hypothetical protein WC291_06515 [Thermodesulfovibrionales bacterium]|jgi:nucleotide-binding universal stress UspA family protein
MARKQLLFVTSSEGQSDEGLPYALDFARTMDLGVSILMVVRKAMSEKWEEIMTAVTFAEAGEHDTARELLSGNSGKEGHLPLIAERCRKEGIAAEVYATSRDILAAISSLIRQKNGIDMVMLSPSVTDKGVLSARDLQRLVKTASRPVVTMARQVTAS